MKRFKTAMTSFALLAALSSRAEFQAVITFQNGASRTMQDLTVRDGRLVLAAENLSVPLNQIRSAEFTFKEITSADCEELIRRGAFEDLSARLGGVLTPLGEGVSLPGGIDSYLLYKLRADFWLRKFDDMQKLARTLQAKNSPLAPLAGLYQVMVLIEQDQSAAALAAFQKIQNPDSVSEPASEYIRGSLAASAREYDKALEHFSRVIVLHRHDPEWAPAAALAEGRVYRRTGYVETAAYVAQQLTTAYADGLWGRRAGELKQEL